MAAKPYIGITGIKTGEEVLALNDALAEAGILGADKEHPTHTAMYGFCVSDKRLADYTQGGTQSPALNDLEQLLCLVPRGVIPMLHYFTNTKDLKRLYCELECLFISDRLKELCNTVQLNGAWPESGNMRRFGEMLHGFKSYCHKVDFVLQIPRTVIEKNTPKEIADNAYDLRGVVSYFLVDASGGKGIEFDETKSLEIMIALREKTQDITPKPRIGIAGGFSDKNVFERVQKLSADFKEPFCIDAQGKLRTTDKEYLELNKAQRYLTWASLAFERAKF